MPSKNSSNNATITIGRSTCTKQLQDWILFVRRSSKRQQERTMLTTIPLQRILRRLLIALNSGCEMSPETQQVLIKNQVIDHVSFDNSGSYLEPWSDT